MPGTTTSLVRPVRRTPDRQRSTGCREAALPPTSGLTPPATDQDHVGYQVPRERVRALLSVPPARPWVADLFVSPVAQTHAGPETLSEMLARAGRFVPTVGRDGSVLLVRTAALRWLKVWDPELVRNTQAATREGVSHPAVVLTFTDDETLEGALVALAPPESRRPLDLVNSTQTFLPLVTAEGVFIVNLDLVTAIGFPEVDRARS
jgi:hypothetical protein